MWMRIQTRRLPSGRRPRVSAGGRLFSTIPSADGFTYAEVGGQVPTRVLRSRGWVACGSGPEELAPVEEAPALTAKTAAKMSASDLIALVLEGGCDAFLSELLAAEIDGKDRVTVRTAILARQELLS